MTAAKKRVVIFISGGGSNMEALIHAAADPAYPAEIVAVISDRSTAGGLQKAAARGVPVLSFERRAYGSKQDHEAAIVAALEPLAPDYLCLAGFMRLLSDDFIERYRNRIINIHPSLLPLFPGLHTHQRAIDAGMKLAGCTVHMVTEVMDVGPVIAQAAVPLLAGDTSETLAARVLKAEHQLYPAALAAICGGHGTGKVTDPDQRLVSFG